MAEKILLHSGLRGFYDSLISMPDMSCMGPYIIDIILKDTKSTNGSGMQDITVDDSIVNHYNESFKKADFVYIIKRNNNLTGEEERQKYGFIDKYFFQLFKYGDKHWFKDIHIVYDKNSWILEGQSISTKIFFDDKNFLLEIRPKNITDIVHNKN
jgi:hypothetical protein